MPNHLDQALRLCRTELSRLRATLDQHAIVSVADPAGRITYVNDKFCQISGFSRAELLGQNHRLIRSGMHPQAFYEEMWATIALGRTWQGEICNRRKDGGLYWVASTIVPFLDDNGLPQEYVSIRTDLTALKRSQETLRLQARAMEASVDGIAIADARAPDMPLIYANPAFVAMTGYPREELLGHNCRFLQGPETGQPELEVIRNALGAGRPGRALLRNYRKDGSLFWNELVIAPVQDDQGVLSHFVGVANDVTRRIEDEFRLRQFREALNSSADGIYLIDRGSERFIDCNTAAAAALGYSREALLRLGPADIKPEVDRASLARLFDQAMTAGERPVIFETLHRRRDGSVFPVEIGLRGFAYQGREVITAVARDITARRQADLALRQSEALLQEAQRIARMGNWVLHLDDGRLDWSAEVYELLGQDPERFRPTLEGFYQLLHGDDVGAARAAQQRAMSGHEVQRVEHRVVLADGSERWMRIQGVGHFNASGRPTHITGTIQDITTERVREAELRRAKEAAECADRAKSEFLSRMSHELRTPMNAILGFTQLLQMQPDLGERARGNVDEIFQAGRHLLDLINEVLDLARIESGRMELRPEPLSCLTLADECLALVEPLAHRRGITLERRYAAPADALVQADRTRSKQVLLNLLSNAVKYNRPQGRVTLSIEAAEAGRAMRFAVRDTGRGIPPERQGEVFQPFHRLVQDNGAEEGTGIGLTICKRLIGEMGGRIGFASVPGGGSTFWFMLPCAGGAPLAREETETRAPEPRQREPEGTVLYVEDNAANARLVATLLHRWGKVRLMVADTPELGLRIAADTHPDLILLDIHLPGMDGYEMFARLKNLPGCADIPVVAVSADAMAKHLQRARDAGFSDYLTKPLVVDRFDAVLEAYLA